MAIRTPWRTSSGVSLTTLRQKSSMSEETSSAGRPQFSVEKAYSVKYFTPQRTAARNEARTGSTPAACPS